MRLPAGTYTLWTIPGKDGHADLIVNKQFGQWGTEYNEKLNLGTQRLAAGTTETPVEKFTISVIPAGGRKGALVMEWGRFRWSAPIVAE